jgi:hypothetical protein
VVLEGVEPIDVEEDEEEWWARARRAVGSREEEEIDAGSSRGRRN